MIASFLLLSQAMKSIPLGTAYAINRYTYSFGAVIAGIILFKEAFTPARCLFVILLLSGIIGLKITSGH